MAILLLGCFLASLAGLSFGQEAAELLQPGDSLQEVPYPFYNPTYSYYPVQHMLAGQQQRNALQGAHILRFSYYNLLICRFLLNLCIFYFREYRTY